MLRRDAGCDFQPRVLCENEFLSSRWLPQSRCEVAWRRGGGLAVHRQRNKKSSSSSHSAASRSRRGWPSALHAAPAMLLCARALCARQLLSVVRVIGRCCAHVAVVVLCACLLYIFRNCTFDTVCVWLSSWSQLPLRPSSGKAAKQRARCCCCRGAFKWLVLTDARREVFSSSPSSSSSTARRS